MKDIVIKAVNYDYSVLEDVQKYHRNLFDKICLMPDTHRGDTIPIGFVGKLNGNGLPIDTIGSDIGCGISVYEIPKDELNIDLIDWFQIHQIMMDLFVHNKRISQKPFSQKTYQLRMKVDFDMNTKHCTQLGTLGGGNHFIEINEGIDKYFIVVHSGSRGLGGDIYKYYMKKINIINNETKGVAIKNLLNSTPKKDRERVLLEFKNNPIEYKDYLFGDIIKDYLYDMEIAIGYAKANRYQIIEDILYMFGLTYNKDNHWECIHNYCDKDGIIRKGAISSKDGEKLIIPINMRDGSIIAIGKGNKEWMCSAPHGAGRIYSRGQAKEIIKLDDFQKSMNSINTFSVSESTLDESPMAYKDINYIIENTKDTMDIVEVIKPIFNFKAQ